MCCRCYIGEGYVVALEELLEDGFPETGKEEFRVTSQDAVRNGTPYDIQPSQTPWVLYQSESSLAAGPMRWGYTNPFRKGLIINARAETVREKQLFMGSIRHRRCVLPVSGFYEWDAWKARYRFRDPSGDLLMLAGIYQREPGRLCFALLTTEANECMKPVHDRMPLMIQRDEILPWLRDPERTDEFLIRPQRELIREQDAGQIRMQF